MPAEFTCSKEARGDVNQSRCSATGEGTNQCLSLGPERELLPRKLYLKQEGFLAHGTSDDGPGCWALVSGGSLSQCGTHVEGS